MPIVLDFDLRENRLQIILNIAKSPRKFQNDMADYCLKTFFDFGGYPQDKSEDAQHNRRVDDQRGYEAGACANDNEDYQYRPNNYTNHSCIILCQHHF